MLRIWLWDLKMKIAKQLSNPKISFLHEGWAWTN